MNPADNIWQVALALVLIVGVVVVLGFIAKRFQVTKGSKTGHLQIVETSYLGPKERLVLVQVADQQILVGINPQCISKLAEFDVSTDFAGVLEQAREIAS